MMMTMTTTTMINTRVKGQGRTVVKFSPKVGTGVHVKRCPVLHTVATHPTQQAIRLR